MHKRNTFNHPLITKLLLLLPIGLIIISVLVVNTTAAKRPRKTKCLVTEYENETELVAAIRRPDKCTVVAFGAPWDPYYKNWAGSGLWDALADEFCSAGGGDDKDPPEVIEIGSYHYSGRRDFKSIPIEAGMELAYTIGSYEIHAYRGGRHYGKVPLRDWNGGGSGVAATPFDLTDVGKAKEVVLGSTACYRDAQDYQRRGDPFRFGRLLQMRLRPSLPAIIVTTIFAFSYVFGYRRRRKYNTKTVKQ